MQRIHGFPWPGGGHWHDPGHPGGSRLWQLPRLRRLLERYGLPDATAYSAQALYEKTLSDKKRSGDAISLVVPIAWGASQLVRIPVSELPAWIERGLGL